MLSALFLISTSSFFFLSSSEYFSASFIILSVSSFESFVLAVIVIFCSFPVPRSFAETFIIPFASISNVTSICGIPLGAGGIPTRLNIPSVVLSAAIERSPCKTCMVTDVWKSAAVENIWDLFVGMVVFLSMSFVETPPSVSTPRDNGVTSSKSKSFTSPARTPPWIAAPAATHSMGSTPPSTFFPIMDSTNFCTIGILVGPPTSIILSMSSCSIFASSNACFVGSLHLSIIGVTSSSSFALESVIVRCLGPDASAVMYGRFISVVTVVESSIFAFSHASLSLCIAILSFLKSIPFPFLNSSAT